MTKVIECKCKHEYQDKRYGNKRRLHNRTDNDMWRCTVCGNTTTGKTVGIKKSQDKSKKKK